PHRTLSYFLLQIFRRADKNDDGKLSFEEFKNYFADGILSSEELWELFSGIDRRHSDNVDTEKLCDYFSAYLGEYRNVLSALETLNSAVLAAMDKTKLWGERNERKAQRELLQLCVQQSCGLEQCCQKPLWCSGFPPQAGYPVREVQRAEASLAPRPGRRCGRRAQKNLCLSPTDPYSGMLTTGSCCCLAATPGDAVCVLLEPAVDLGGEQQRRGVPPGLQVLHRAHCWPQQLPAVSVAPGGGCGVAPPNVWAFNTAPLGARRGLCAGHVSACKLTDEACFILYEFWQDVTSWRSHLQSSCSKTFQRSIISLLESPELLTTMLFPASWWIMNNN
ncbi:N-terminal EF-hand calcium-binding protein 3, partial [Dryobates pubescens]